MDHTTLWYQVVTDIHHLSHKPSDYFSMITLKDVWNNIISEKNEIYKDGIMFSNILTKSVG